MFNQILYVSTLTFLLLFSGNVAAQNQVNYVPMEHHIKAAFLVKFIKYIDWPSSNSPSEKNKFKMGVFGESPIAGNLFALMPKKINGWRLEISKIRDLEDTSDCHLVFLTSSEIHRYVEIITGLKNSSILTVSDTKNFLDMGGMIKFLSLDQMVRFEVNLKVAQKAGLRISSELLQLATTVHK